MKNILVVDDNTNFVNMLIRYFKNNPKINIKYIGEDGEKGLKILIEHKDDIDLILLDLVMPKKDGLYFLKEFKKLNLRKNIIVMTSLNSDTIIRKVSNYQVDDFILKPYSFEDLETKLMESVTSKRDNKDVKQELSKLLHELGIPSNIKGYEYLREAIINLYNAKNISGITKELYPDIASK